MNPMSRSRVLATALCLGLVTAILVYAFLKSQATRAGAQQSVVAAREDIPARTIIKQGMVEIKSFPRSALPPASSENVESVVGSVALTPIEAGKPISLRQVAPKGAALGLSYAVPPFMRAVTVAVDPIIGVAGFLKPGDHVDVVATFDVNRGTVTKTILQDVELLATGSQVVETEIDPSTGKPAKPKSQPNATLSVTPRNAERLILADSKGELRLTLRPTDDRSFVVSKGITSRGMLGIVPPDVPERSVSRAGAPSGGRVESAPQPIIREPAPAPWTLERLPPGSAPSGLETGKKVQIVRGTEIEEMVVAD